MYKVTLTKEEREELKSILRKGRHTSDQYRCACILLNVDEGKYTDGPSAVESICKMLRIEMRTIEGVKKKFVEEGIESVLERKAPNR